MNHPTPTRHGAWRVIDGQLVDENDVDQITPALDPDRCAKCGLNPDAMVASCTSPGCPIFPAVTSPTIDGRAATEASLGDQAGPAEPRSTQRRKAPSKPR